VSWFPTRRGGGVPVVCIPSAGGASTAYRDFNGVAADLCIVPVELPGRGTRLAEPLPRSISTLADGLATSIVETFASPVALFGHSMGASVAFETARQLSAQNHPPLALVVSGRAPRGRVLEWHLDDDATLVEKLVALGGTPRAVLDNDELRALFLPIIRADFALLSSYVLEPSPRLQTPILAVAGLDDPAVTREGLEEWSELTTGALEVEMFAGGHFHFTDPRPLLARISRFIAKQTRS
jgi:surfactin synthase thioesterase subunit